MDDFPQFMRNSKNRIKKTSQYSKGIEGYVFDGKDGSQLAFWTCHGARKSAEHSHPYDEYVVCVQGQYKVIMKEKVIVLNPGNEFLISKGILHGAKSVVGTRTIHAFGGKRAERESE